MTSYIVSLMCTVPMFSLQGGFAKCYELTDSVTKQVLAGKIVPKTLLVKPHQREKVLLHCCLKLCCVHFLADRDKVNCLSVCNNNNNNNTVFI